MNGTVLFYTSFIVRDEWCCTVSHQIIFTVTIRDHVFRNKYHVKIYYRTLSVSLLPPENHPLAETRRNRNIHSRVDVDSALGTPVPQKRLPTPPLPYTLSEEEASYQRHCILLPVLQLQAVLLWVQGQVAANILPSILRKKCSPNQAGDGTYSLSCRTACGLAWTPRRRLPVRWWMEWFSQY
jgi:hypothetical protein